MSGETLLTPYASLRVQRSDDDTKDNMFCSPVPDNKTLKARTPEASGTMRKEMLEKTRQELEYRL